MRTWRLHPFNRGWCLLEALNHFQCDDSGKGAYALHDATTKTLCTERIDEGR